VVRRPVESELKESFMDYAMSVIISRALPDVRDGLKPVHRRILYSMHESGMHSDKPFKKSARIVGDVLGKYHPHGDTAVYDSMVRMAQDFSLRYPLIDGQGNFGSIDGDSAAAMRYTESRMSKLAMELCRDLDKDTVDFQPNYDGSLEAPVALPSKAPNLLINGSSGIAVGMATNIPPHNLGEVVDAITLLIDEPDVDLHRLMEIMPGPDFPTGGIIYGKQGIQSAYFHGRGKIRVRGRINVEEVSGKRKLIITEIPYQVNKSRLLEVIASLVKEKRIDGITELRDESDRDGMRIVMELRRDAMDDVIINQLYNFSPLQTTFGVYNLALVDNQPKVLSLPETLTHFINHRRDVVRRRCIFELNKAKERAHILEGLLIALENLDEVISLIRSSASPEEARDGLIEKFELSLEQAKAILDMRLQKLTGLERDKIKDEHEELLEKIARLEAILASEQEILNIVKEELAEIKEKFGDARRTEISSEDIELDIEDLIPVEDVVVTLTQGGYVKRMPIDTYRQQHRGGRGLMGMTTKEGDTVVDAFITSSHSYLLFFTNFGKVYWLKAYRVPEGSRYSRGRPLVNLINVDEGETVNTIIPVKEFEEGFHLVFATKWGVIKKTKLMAFCHPRVTGIKALGLNPGDELVNVRLTSGEHEVVLATSDGLANRFSEKDVRSMGRTARGVRGIRVRKGKEVVGMEMVDESSILFTVTENGYGKRSYVKDYRKTRSGGKGVINIKTDVRNGLVMAIREVTDSHDLLVITKMGMVIRLPVSSISLIGRATKGVRIINLKEGDKVVAICRLERSEKDDEIDEGPGEGIPIEGVEVTEVGEEEEEGDEEEVEGEEEDEDLEDTDEEYELVEVDENGSGASVDEDNEDED